MLKTEWTKPGTGRTVGELRRWAGIPCFLTPDEQDCRKTSLDIVRSGPPEPYDVERVEEAIRRVGVEEASTQTIVVSDDVGKEFTQLRVAVARGIAKRRLEEAQADVEQAIRLMDFTLQRRTRARFEEARAIWHRAKEVYQSAVATNALVRQ